MIKDQIEKEIILCPECNGTGALSISARGCKTLYMKCKVCDGKGRLLKLVETKYEILKDLETII